MPLYSDLFQFKHKQAAHEFHLPTQSLYDHRGNGAKHIAHIYTNESKDAVVLAELLSSANRPLANWTDSIICLALLFDFPLVIPTYTQVGEYKYSNRRARLLA